MNSKYYKKDVIKKYKKEIMSKIDSKEEYSQLYNDLGVLGVIYVLVDQLENEDLREDFDNFIERIVKELKGEK